MNREHDCYDILFTIHCEAIFPTEDEFPKLLIVKPKKEAQDEIRPF